jgi:nucleotide-binding universal stress UspA family protein
MPGATPRNSTGAPAESFGVIAVAFDGTRAAWHAVGYAARTARRARADLEILRVTEPPPCANGSAVGSSEARRSMLDELQRVVASVAPAIDAQGVILYGDPVDELVRASFRFDLLVLGSRGAGAAHAVRLGPVSALVTGQAACRVVVVAPPARAGRLRAEEYVARPRLLTDVLRGGAA